MRLLSQACANEEGSTAVETAFALPVLIVMIWMLVQFGQIYQALAGIQQGLGEGARYATLCISASTSGCTSPSATEIKAKITENVFGTGLGTFTVANPASGSSGTSRFYDLTVNYTQPTDLIFFRGPTVSFSRSKRVWIAATS
jgi:Flp pilus assembly protein TadG